MAISPLFLILSFLCLYPIFSSSTNPSSSILDLDLQKYTSHEQVSTLFQLWKKEHGRVYQNKEEEAKKLEIFHNNLNHIRHTNANRKSPHSYRLGLNKFADISPEEFTKTYLQQPIFAKDVSLTNNNNMNSKKREHSSQYHDAPASWDWRKKGVVTEVKYQGDCGSGWAFSATGAIESVNAIVTGKLVNLSEQEIIDCATKARGCYNGYHIHAFDWVIENGGINTQIDYPYTATDDVCKANKTEGSKATIDGFTNIIIAANYSTPEEEENALQLATLQQPISVAMDAKDFHFYTGGVYDGANCSSPYGINHFVLFVGYGTVDGKDYWIAKNSFGKDWGIDGYIWIQRNTGNKNPAGVCAIHFFVSYPTKKEYSPTISVSPKAGVKDHQRILDYSSL